jgi:hypothetical protein
MSQAARQLEVSVQVDDAVLYKQVNEIHDRFVNTEKLKECHHGFSSQKTDP